MPTRKYVKSFECIELFTHIPIYVYIYIYNDLFLLTDKNLIFFSDNEHKFIGFCSVIVLRNPTKLRIIFLGLARVVHAIQDGTNRVRRPVRKVFARTTDRVTSGCTFNG